ncbi:MAG: S-adenosylmethionine:tRNA ribosyltransferase-isomerase [Cyclobacteriaceae bacterium]|nr:S-adenosylmethionine:tRNA ribosyltransferase-isomerase [Cyclobacteriaceae bacterium]
MKPPISILDYTYTLPEERIADVPLENRDASKLLVYNHGNIEHSEFTSLPDYLPTNTLLFFNNTRVIPARIYFHKETGATIEVFLLQPAQPSSILAETMQATKSCQWYCTIGNLKRWKDQNKLTKNVDGGVLTAELINREQGLIEFIWSPANLSFAEIISKVGITPLPPYIKRDANKDDLNRYQTVYSHHEGAVAAPTAGLHFTESVLKELDTKGIKKDFLTLHVSAGTFQPVKTENAREHIMHQEQVMVSVQNIENLLQADSLIVAVGTTSMRTLESLYWYGVKLMHDEKAAFVIDQEDAYQNYSNLPDRKEALTAVMKYMKENKLSILIGHTSIYILPGYTFRICRGLITNFHLPGSTLMLLVAAFVGEDWKKIYQGALNNNYRFLSYGDSSLLLP